MLLDDYKEKCYLTVISNLLKKINFLELEQLKDTDQISESDFLEDLEINFKKYSIEIKDLAGNDDSSVIFDMASRIFKIMKEIGKHDISDDNLAELFSLKSEVFDGKEINNM